MSSNTGVRVPQPSAISSPVIGIVVGEHPDQREFFIHQDLICSHSRFFEYAMKKPWKEAKEHKITLPEQEPGMFLLYMGLLYSSDLMVKTTGPPSTEFDEYLTLSKLYVLAEMLVDEMTKDKVLAAIRKKTAETCLKDKDHYPDSYCIEVIYGGTPAGSPARRLLVDLFTEIGDGKCYIVNAADLPKDFFFDLTAELLAKRAMPKQHMKLKADLSVSKEESASKGKTIQTIQDENKKLKKDLVDAKAKLAPKK